MSYLEIKNLQKKYIVHGENLEVLKGIDLDVDQGEIYGIIGFSGAGKSTLARCINRLENSDAGSIKVGGVDILALDKKALLKERRKIGMVFQSYDLFPHKTVLENILLAPVKVQKRKRAEAEAEAMELLERVGLAGRKNDYPRQLSGGQKQRIAIVRALIMHPEVLLLDEITAALDPEMVHEVLQVVLDLAKSGSTMLIVTHEMAFAKAIADRVLFFEHGEIVEESHAPKAFFERPQTERARQFLKSFEY